MSTMMKCPQCGPTGTLFIPGNMTRQCPNCGHVFAAASAAPVFNTAEGQVAAGTTGPVAAYLAQVRADWDTPGGKPVHHVPRLVAALEAVLAAHRITQGGDGRDRCAWCREYYGERAMWPCGEYLTISAALLGPETVPARRGDDALEDGP